MTLMRTIQVNPAEEPFAMLSGKRLYPHVCRKHRNFSREHPFWGFPSLETNPNVLLQACCGVDALHSAAHQRSSDGVRSPAEPRT